MKNINLDLLTQLKMSSTPDKLLINALALCYTTLLNLLWCSLRQAIYWETIGIFLALSTFIIFSISFNRFSYTLKDFFLFSTFLSALYTLYHILQSNLINLFQICTHFIGFCFLMALLIALLIELLKSIYAKLTYGKNTSFTFFMVMLLLLGLLTFMRLFIH